MYHGSSLISRDSKSNSLSCNKHQSVISLPQFNVVFTVIGWNNVFQRGIETGFSKIYYIKEQFPTIKKINDLPKNISTW